MRVARGGSPFVTILLVAVTLARHRRRLLGVLVLWGLALALLVVPLTSAAPAPTTPGPSHQAPAPSPLTLQQLFKQSAPAVALIQQFDAKNGLASLGSGFVVAPLGVVVTNNHVIKPVNGSVRITVTLPARGDTFRDVRVIYAEEQRDFAVLSIKAVGLPTIKVGDSDSVQVGDQVVAIGNPITPGLALTFTVGYVEAVRMNPYADYRIIQHQAPITPGNSGGPLINMKDEVVGINTLSFVFENAAQNLNGAIPINYVKPYFNDSAKMTWAEWAALTATTPAPTRPAPAPQPTPTPGPAPVPASCGTWHSNYGDITLQCGQSTSGGLWFLTGYWDQAAGKRGIIKGGTFNPATGVVQFDYYQSWNNVNGSATFTLESNGTRMEGHWSQSNGDSGSWSAWR